MLDVIERLQPDVTCLHDDIDHLPMAIEDLRARV